MPHDDSYKLVVSNLKPCNFYTYIHCSKKYTQYFIGIFLCRLCKFRNNFYYYSIIHILLVKNKSEI